MNVQVIEAETGRLLATYPITLAGSGYERSEQDFFAEAWRCAIEDDLVDADRRDKYVMRLLSDER